MWDAQFLHAYICFYHDFMLLNLLHNVMSLPMMNIDIHYHEKTISQLHA